MDQPISLRIRRIILLITYRYKRSYNVSQSIYYIDDLFNIAYSKYTANQIE